MRIALVLQNAWPLIGGLELISRRIAQELHAAGHEGRIIARFSETRQPLPRYFSATEPSRTFRDGGVSTAVIGIGWLEKLLLWPVFKLIWRPRTLPLARALFNVVMVPKLVRRARGADLLHYFGNGAELLGFASAAAARQLAIPFLIEPALHPGQWGDSWIDWKLYRSADRILAHTASEQEFLVAGGLAPGLIRVVTIGVDLRADGDPGRFRQAHRIAATSPVILFLGRKTEAKGFQRLIEAVALLRAEFPALVLVLAGPSAGKAAAPALDHLRDLDDLSDQEKQDALAACTLLCVPSEGESFGLAYYEAWGYRKPVVGLDLPALRGPIQAGRAGLLTAADPASIAGALRTLLRDPDRAAAMGERGWATARRHAWPEAIQSYLGVYGELR